MHRSMSAKEDGSEDVAKPLSDLIQTRDLRAMLRARFRYVSFRFLRFSFPEKKKIGKKRSDYKTCNSARAVVVSLVWERCSTTAISQRIWIALFDGQHQARIAVFST